MKAISSKKTVTMLLLTVTVLLMFTFCSVFASAQYICPGEHTPATAVKEMVVEPSCLQAGGYDEVVYCSVCSTQISRTHITLDASTDYHVPAAPVQEKVVPASCTAEGSCDEVIYCTVCRAELSRTAKIIQKKAHSFDVAAPYQEYIATEATRTSAPTYYYSCVCGEKGEQTFTYGNPLPGLVTYVVNGEVVDTKEVYYGEKIPEIEAPYLYDYIFDGWSDMPETMPEEDITVTAQYHAKPTNEFPVDDTIWFIRLIISVFAKIFALFT